jgi:hypothetical protein
MDTERLIAVLQACLDDGYTETELVVNHPDSGRRIEYDIASVEYARPVVYIHADYEGGL